MKSDYVYSLIERILYDEKYYYFDGEIKDYRGAVEVHCSFEEMMTFVQDVEKRGWNGFVEHDPKRLLFGVSFDMTGPDYDGFKVFCKVSGMNNVVKNLKNSYPEIVSEMNLLMSSKNKLFREVIPSRYKENEE